MSKYPKGYWLMVTYYVASNVFCQSIIYPSLHFIALDTENKKTFHALATLASIADNIPLLLSVFIGIISSKITLSRLSFITTALATIICLYYHYSIKNAFSFTIVVISLGIMNRALGLAIDKLICQHLMFYIKSLQSDIFLYQSILSLAAFLFSYKIYLLLGQSGLLILYLSFQYLIFLLIILINHSYKGTVVEKIVFIGNIKKLSVILVSSKKLNYYIIYIIIFMFATSGFNLFLQAKIHAENLPIKIINDFFIMATFGGIIASIIYKVRFFHELQSITIFSVGLFIIILCFFGLVPQTTSALIKIIYFLWGFAYSIIIISYTTEAFAIMSKNNKLVQIAPLISGLVGGIISFVSIIAPLIYGLLLNSGIYFTFLIFFDVSIIMILILVILKIKLSSKNSWD